MPIQVLSDLVVAQIAAGEVVERPASVVKELIENALDAGANHIQVGVAGGGQQLLRVSDNGSGIRSDEIALAFARHATSKLTSAEDLTHLITLGFRGEALCSIAAVSHVTCISRHRSESHGTKLVLEGGDIVTRQAIGAPTGTVITVENLFYNVPARLKFLKKDATEKRQIAQVVTLMAMAYPNVRFVLEQDGREVFRSPGNDQLEDVLVAAYGVEEVRRLLPVAASTGTVGVTGFTSSPELWRTDRSRINVFVNGRVIQDNNLTYAVTQAYQSVFQPGQYPVAALMVRLPSEDVDVNVHPTKAEVRFRDPGAVFAGVQRAVREAVVGVQTQLSMTHNGPRIIGGLLAPRLPQPGLGLAGEEPATPNFARIAPGDVSPQDDLSHIPEGPGAPDRPRTLPVLRVVGQVGARYIVAEGPAGVYLVDQHNAHARVLFEQLRSQFEAGSFKLTDAIQGTVTVTPASAALVEQARSLFATVGIELVPFGPNTFRVAQAPDLVENFDAETIVTALLPDLRADDPQAAVMRGLCRLAAVKAGQILTQEQMQSLIRQLERTPEPYSSPDGSPTILHLSSDQLLHEFRRR